MPIAELLGVQVDMQLLLKLSFSVAAVLLVSWAYKFYSSRDAKTTQLCAGEEKEQGKATCTNCKTTLQSQSLPNQDTKDGAKRSKPGDPTFDCSKATLQSPSSTNNEASSEGKQPEVADSPRDILRCQNSATKALGDGAAQSKTGDLTYESTEEILQHPNQQIHDTKKGEKQSKTDDMTFNNDKETLRHRSPTNYNKEGAMQSKPSELISKSTLETAQCRSSQINRMDSGVSQSRPWDQKFEHTKTPLQRQSSPNNSRDYKASQSKPSDAKFNSTKTMQQLGSSPNQNTDNVALHPKPAEVTSMSIKETSTQHCQSLPNYVTEDGASQSKPGDQKFNSTEDTLQRQSLAKNDTDLTATQPRHGDLTSTGNKETLTQHLQSLSSNILDYGTRQPKPGAPMFISAKETLQHQSSPNNETDFRAKQAEPGALMSDSTKKMLTKEHPSSPNYVTQSKPGDSTLDATKKMLLLRSSPNYDIDNRAEQLRSGASKSIDICKNLPTHATDAEPKKSKSGDPNSDHTKENPTMAPPCKAEQSRDAFSMSNSGRNTSIKADMLPLQKQAEDATRNISSGSALNLPHPTESGTASATGRRSPCFLQKLEGSVGVGRELRQDLERQGAYSSFLSKAEIKVEDANVVLEGKEEPVVRGKIYDYYVESSSHSIMDRTGQFERKCESQPSCSADSPSSFSPIIMRDLVVAQNAAEDPSSLRSPPSRPVLLRKESYLSAAEQSELPIPSPTRMTHSLTSAGDESITVYHMILSSTGSEAREAADLVVAGAPLSHPPALQGADLENLKSKLDLGNCLEALCLAKRHGQASVQQAALGVMSDNYLQVLMDPNLYGRLLAGEREQIRKQRMKGRRFVMVADMDPQDWVRGPETKQRRTSSAVYCYDDYKDTWHQLCPIPQEVISKACAMCTMDNYLFVAVGCQGTEREMAPSKRVFCFNPLTSIWKEISPMNEARPRCKLAALEGYIYAIGGECLSSVERYDPRLDRWTFVAPLPNDTFAVAHHVTASNGELFVSGGTLRYLLLRYSPKTNSWRPSRVVSSKDRTADMVAVGRFLYRFDVNPLLGVSVYRYHTVARLWYECSSKRLQRCPIFQCATVDNTVYCISRQFTMKFEADEISPAFAEEDLSVLSAAKGILYPFVLSLPDKTPRQTSV